MPSTAFTDAHLFSLVDLTSSMISYSVLTYAIAFFKYALEFSLRNIVIL